METLGWLLRTATQVAEGLARMHAARVLHRDVKPGNILLGIGSNGGIAALLGDMGAAAQLAPSRALSNSPGEAEEAQLQACLHSRCVTTYNYAPPEALLHGRYFITSDIWSLGVIIVEGFQQKRSWLQPTLAPEEVQS